MTITDSVKLRMPSYPPGRTDVIARMVLIKEIVFGRLIPPDAEILLDGRWTELRDCPEAPWLDELVRQAIAAAGSCDAQRLSALVEKILLYGGNQDDRESVGVAKFLKAHLCLADGNYPEARRLLEPAVRKPSLVRAAAHNNLGVAWVWAREAAAALSEFQAALDPDADLLVTRINLRNLARQMLFERASNLPGRPTWNELFREAEAGLREVPAEEIRAFVSGDRPFPGYQVLHVVQIPTGFPRLSAGLPVNPTAEPAARRLLQRARAALADRHYPQAKVLAAEAAKICPPVQAEANELITAAQLKIEEAVCLEQTSTYADQVERPQYVDRSLGTATREKIAGVADCLAHGDPDAAKQQLPTLLTAATPPRLVAELKTGTSVGKLLQKAQACLAGKDQAGAVRCLRRVVSQAPRNRDALQQLFGLELLTKRPLAGQDLKMVVEAGQEAIEAFLADDPRRCQEACQAVLRVLKSSHLVSHLQNAFPLES